MGCNYYLHVGTCPTCGHVKEKHHIGKTPAGLKFKFDTSGFLGDELMHHKCGSPLELCLNYIVNLAEPYEIVDEYGAKYELDGLVTVVLLRTKLKSESSEVPDVISHGLYDSLDKEFS